MYIQYFFTPRAKGPHVLNKACNLLVIYWKTKGIPKSDNSEKRSSAHKRTKSLRRKYRGQNATLPSTLDSRYEGWVLRIENIHLFATFFNEYNGNREKGKDWSGNRKGYWEAKCTDIHRNQRQLEHFHQWVIIIKSIFILIVVKSKLKRNGRGFWKG